MHVVAVRCLLKTVFTAPIPTDDHERLQTLYRYNILDSEPEPGYDEITALASHICEAPFATITLVDRDRQWFKSEIGFGVTETNRAEGFCACAVVSPEPMIVADAVTDPRFAENPFVVGGPKIRFYAGAPLVAHNSHILGTICVLDTRPRCLSAVQVQALEALARQTVALMESRRRMQELEKATAALLQSEKLAAVGRLASSMSHDINNPLAAITNLLFLAGNEEELPKIRDWISQAELELRRISVIANQALRFHKQKSRPEWISCVSLFHATLEIYESRIRNALITVEKHKLTTEPVNCLAGDIRHVLSNIIVNAIDAMPTGGRLLVRSRTATDWKTNRKGFVLTVADTGHGMSPSTASQAFEAFFTTKGEKASGLGLWISAEIMQRHEGRLSLRSSQSPRHRGTVVAIFLPLSVDSVPVVRR